MNQAMEYQAKIQSLFNEWKAKPEKNGIDHQNSIFVRDGIVCPEQWYSQETRPMFLLKEAYGGNGDWDLIADHLLTSGKMGRGTWRRVTEWTRGLLSTSSSYIEPYADDSANCYGNQCLKKIAVVNVRKSGGTPSSNMECINNYARTDASELKCEIELIDPTVIVCGYTISSLNIIMGHDIKNYGKTNSNLYYHMTLNKHDVIVLDYWHPSNHYPDIMNYYGLIGIYQQALLQKGK
ncbi:MAG: hypothetical protein Q4C12_02405 [Clostridia bacterium]|nr:hypothetical protein [Clostridia bacterium]